MNALFRDPPPVALKVFLLAAVVSYVGVAATHVEGCFPHTGECLLLSPAVLIFWAPAFIATWIVLALVTKAIWRGRRVLPSIRWDRERERESPYLRMKAEGGLSVTAGGFSCIALQGVARAVATRTTGRAHEAAVAADQFMHTRLGIALVILVVGLAACWALRRMQRPADNELG